MQDEILPAGNRWTDPGNPERNDKFSLSTGRKLTESKTGLDLRVKL